MILQFAWVKPMPAPAARNLSQRSSRVRVVLP